MSYDWKPYVPVAERRRKAEREMEKRRKKGESVSPVRIAGRTIARTFWGKAWCENLERYSDYANRLPRGRTYVRNGSVVDLQIGPGLVEAQVMGSELYRVAVKVKPLPKARWADLCGECAGAIDSLVELLQGRFSKGVMELICRPKTGLFPAPAEIELSCSCPDWATMCKHVAAVLYGIGARLDESPELLFRLRGVDEQELLAGTARLPLAKPAPASGKVLEGGDLADIFGLDLAGAPAPEPEPKPKARKPAAPKPAPARKAKVPAKASSAVKPKAAAEPKAVEKPEKRTAKPQASAKPPQGQTPPPAAAAPPPARKRPRPGRGRR